MGTPFAHRNQPLSTLPNHSTPKNDLERRRAKSKYDNLIACKENNLQNRMSTSSPVKIYRDPKVSPECPVTNCSRDTQTDDYLLDTLIEERCLNSEVDSGRGSTLNDQDAVDMLVNDTPSENYWKDLAEERRRALQETLEENKKLSELNESLREENLNLSEVANRAAELEELLKDIMPEDGEDEEEDGDGDDVLHSTDSSPSDTSGDGSSKSFPKQGPTETEGNSAQDAS